MNPNWEKYKIGDFLKKSSETVQVSDEKEYRQVTVKLNGKGVALRCIKLGSDIKTKRQFLAQKGQFIASRIDARNGAFGLIPADLDGAIVTGDFPLFIFDKSIVDESFFDYFIKSNQLLRACINASKGTTNRQRLKEDIFLSLEVLIPSIPEQKEIVQKLNKISLKIKEIERIKENSIESLNTLLGSEIMKAIESLNAPSVSLSDGIYFGINEAKINPQKAFGTQEFDYIDIESVLPNGINKINDPKKMLGISAPSRARRLVKENDIIMSSVRPYLRSFAIVPKKLNGAVCSTGFNVISCRNLALPKYVFYALISPFVIDQCNELMKGAHYPALNKNSLSKINFPLPDIQKQKLIIKKIEGIEYKIQQSKSYFHEFSSAKLFSVVLKDSLGNAPVKKHSNLNWFAIKQGIGATLEALSQTSYERGEMVLAKYIYFLQEIYKIQFGLNFVRHNFGPYDPNIKRAILASSFNKDKFFKVRGVGDKQVYTLGDNKDKLFLYSSHILADSRTALGELLKYTSKAQSDDIERLATVCKIVQDLKSTNLDEVRSEMENWKVEGKEYKSKAEKFTELQTINCLNFIVQHGWDKKLINQ